MRGTKICTKPSNILQLAAIVIKINRHGISHGFEGEEALHIFPCTHSLFPPLFFVSLTHVPSHFAFLLVSALSPPYRAGVARPF